MRGILDCLVSYFGLDEDERPTYRRYFAYHVLAGPGPKAGAGVAYVTTLAVWDGAERCTFCPNVHTVEAGGPAAALAGAVRYLDAHHQHDHLRKVQSDIRGILDDQAVDGVRPPKRTATRSASGKHHAPKQ